MASVNEGDIIEGIFALSLALHLADGKIDKTKLNRLRTQIEPSKFQSGRVKLNIAKNVKKAIGGKAIDFVTVNLEIRLKAASVTGAFGKDFKILYTKHSDVGDIDRKINQLIAQIGTSSAMRRVDSVLNTYYKNNIGELITLDIIADGIAGESSGGDIKGDVALEVQVSTSKGNKKVLNQSIPFSLKSNSVTVANLSPYNGMVAFGDAMKLKWKGAEKYKEINKTAKTETEKKAKFALIQAMFLELKKELKAQSKHPEFSRNAFDFIYKSIFGSDLADVIDITSSGIKEISHEYFDQLRATTSLELEEGPNALKFIDKKTKTPLFQIRTKLRPPPAANGAGEAKFYLEVGKAAYVNH